LRYGIDILHSSSNTWKLLFGTYTYIRSYCRADQATDISSNSCPRLFRGNYCEGIASSTSANCRLQLYMATRGGKRRRIVSTTSGNVDWDEGTRKPLAVEMQGHFVSWDSLSATARATYQLKQCIMRDHRQDAI